MLSGTQLLEVTVWLCISALGIGNSVGIFMKLILNVWTLCVILSDESGVQYTTVNFDARRVA